MAKLVLKIMAAPAAWKIRNVMSDFIDQAWLHNRENNEKIMMPEMNIFFLPQMSAMRPTGNSKDAVTNKKLLTSQLSITALPFRSLPIEGIARLTALPMKGGKNEDIADVIKAYFLMDVAFESNETSG